MGVLVVVVWVGSEYERGGEGWWWEKGKKKKGKRKGKEQGERKESKGKGGVKKAKSTEREGTYPAHVGCFLSLPSPSLLSNALLPSSSASLSLLRSSRNPSQPPRAVFPGEEEKGQERAKERKGQGGKNICHLAEPH